MLSIGLCCNEASHSFCAFELSIRACCNEAGHNICAVKLSIRLCNEARYISCAFEHRTVQ